MREIFEGVAQPVATVFTRGAWVGRGSARWRVVAIDGFEVDVPDSAENVEAFAYSGASSQNAPAYPKARVVALAECGTHAFLVARVGSAAVGERTMVRELFARLQPEELLTADRGFYSFDDWAHAGSTGADLLWRASTNLHLPVIDVLPDGSYLSVLVNPKYRAARRERVVIAARAGVDLDPRDGHRVRVIEYDVPDRQPGPPRPTSPTNPTGATGGDLIVLLSTILDPHAARADDLADAYHARWEEETAFDQLKTHLRGPGRILRSRLPDLVTQEIWAWLIVHYAITALIAAAAEAADIDPDRISFTQTLRLVRRSATGTADIPPSGLD